MLNNKDRMGALYFDSSVTSARVFHTINNNIATQDFSVHLRFKVPTVDPSATAGIFCLSSSSTSASVASSLQIMMSTGGVIQVQINGAGGTSDFNQEAGPDLVSLCPGKIIDLVVVRDTDVPSLTMYINGVAQTLTSSTGGTPPTWAGSITSTYALIGARTSTGIFTDRIYIARLYNRTLSQSEVTTLRESGMLFADQWGTFTPVITYVTPTLNGGFETAGGGGADIFANWTETTAGTSTVNDDTIDFHSGAHSCRFDVDASNSSVDVRQTVLTVKKNYRLTLWAKASDITNAPTLQNASTTSTTTIATLTTSWAQYTQEFTANTTSMRIQRGANCQSISVYIDDIELTEIGVILDPDLENADSSKTTIVRDKSTNKYTGTITATGVSQVKPLIQLNPSIIVMDAGIGTAGASGISVGWFNQAARTYTDNSTAASGTAVSFGFNNYQQPTLAATNSSVTTTDAATLYIANSPANGTNMTITNPWSLWIDAGKVRFDGGGQMTGTWSDLGTVTTIDINGGSIDGVTIGAASAGAITGTTITANTNFSGSLTGNVTGNCSGTAATVTGATQASITTCANLTTVGTIGTGVWQGTTVKANYLQQAAADLGAADVSVDLSNSNGSYVTNLTTDGIFKSGGRNVTVTVQTDTYTVGANIDLVVCNKGTAMTVNLPAASASGRKIYIKNINAGVVTVDGDSSDTIDGAATQTVNQWSSITIVDYAANAWVII
jgi:hypothetical protein